MRILAGGIMKIKGNELKNEKKYLLDTLGILKNILTVYKKNIDKNTKEIYQRKRELWDNQGIYDEIEISDERYNINQEVLDVDNEIKKYNKLDKSIDSPYFARIDFNSDKVSGKFYIGINSINDGKKFKVIDWRTPLASIYYNYEKGPASYEAPTGKIEGNLERKRQYKIKNSELIYAIENSLNIDDTYLQEILSSNSGEKMSNIVNTIQKEQNAVIRNTRDKYLIVSGLAGSGKTSVALHRIAYLLYRDRDLNSQNIVILSPNDIFSEYISNVLPELGEENVSNITFNQLVKKIL